MLPEIPTYTFIQTYTFINFQQKVLPIRLFPPILLLIFKEISHLYFYSEPSSIRNSRVMAALIQSMKYFINLVLGNAKFILAAQSPQNMSNSPTNTFRTLCMGGINQKRIQNILWIKIFGIESYFCN